VDEREELIAPEEELRSSPSKSQVKRELHALQDLAERLLAMPRAELERLSLSAATWKAVDETARIKDHRALRRHYKHIAKLLAREDLDAVRALTDQKEGIKQEAAARHHRLERWRERLIDEGDAALGELLREAPDLDRQRLRTLVRAAQKDREQSKPEAPRKLFRFLRDALGVEQAKRFHRDT
jgi:ribosome-associated protein